MAASEDSDATVASEGNQSAEEEGGGRSPSVLLPRPVAAVNPNTEKVPCSSEEGSEGEMSEEYPPPNSSWPVRIEHVTTSTALPGLKHNYQLPSQRAVSSREEHKHGQSPLMSVREIAELQSAILTELQTANSDTGTLQQRVAAVEGHLKAVSLANQVERKRLADAHSALTGGNSQGETSQSIREQLLSLASRQKQLLQRFVQQKELASKISEVCRQRAAGQVTESSGPLPPILRHAAVSTKDTRPPSSAPLTSMVLTTAQPLAAAAQTTSQEVHIVTNTALSQASIPPPTSQHCSDSQPSSKLPPDLAQPVPLDVLISHQLVATGRNSLACTLMGCVFRASLLADGCLVSEDSRKFSVPQQWLSACWAALGHKKRVKKKQAYKMILYKGVPLLHYCEKYSLQQVSSYLSQKQDTTGSQREDIESEQCRSGGANLVTPHPVPSHHLPTSAKVLNNGRVLLIRGSGLQLPPDFWKDEQWTPELVHQLNSDLNW